jgi:hypothetical protein
MSSAHEQTDRAQLTRSVTLRPSNAPDPRVRYSSDTNRASSQPRTEMGTAFWLSYIAHNARLHTPPSRRM